MGEDIDEKTGGLDESGCTTRAGEETTTARVEHFGAFSLSTLFFLDFAIHDTTAPRHLLFCAIFAPRLGLIQTRPPRYPIYALGGGNIDAYMEAAFHEKEHTNIPRG